MTQQDFPSLVRKYREEKGITQQQLAQACGLSRTSVTHIESGYQRIYLEQAQKIAAYLGIPGDEIAVLFAPQQTEMNFE